MKNKNAPLAKKSGVDAPKKIALSTSVYLDMMRFGASFLVYIFHMGHFSGYHIQYIGNYGNEAVLVFFVLSGFVIAYSATTKHPDIVDFSIARLARLWSVVLPALLLTLFADTVGRGIAAAAYVPLQPYTAFKWLASLSATALFLNQIWSLDIWPGSNGVFWSLSYEAWYYWLFALAFYWRGTRRRIGLALSCAIAGPKILIALPIWLIGVGLYRWMRRHQGPSAVFGGFLWAGSLGLLLLYHALDLTTRLQAAWPRVAALASTQWDVDFWPKSVILGLLIGFHIVGLHAFGTHLDGVTRRCAATVRKIADLSFGLYLFHYPLGYLFKAITLALQIHGWAAIALIYLGVFAVSCALARLCESQKFLYSRTLNRIAGRRPPRRSA